MHRKANVTDTMHEPHPQMSAPSPTTRRSCPSTPQVWRAALGGLLVGLGSSLGNGCTSGHGICGSARLSPRSFAYTATFMAAGMAAATATGTASALAIAPVAPSLVLPGLHEVQLAASLAAAGLATFGALAAAARIFSARSSSSASISTVSAKPANAAGTSSALSAIPTSSGGSGGSAPAVFELTAEAAAGALFALGLGFSGMTHPTKGKQVVLSSELPPGTTLLITSCHCSCGAAHKWQRGPDSRACILTSSHLPQQLYDI